MDADQERGACGSRGAPEPSLDVTHGHVRNHPEHHRARSRSRSQTRTPTQRQRGVQPTPHPRPRNTASSGAQRLRLPAHLTQRGQPHHHERDTFLIERMTLFGFIPDLSWQSSAYTVKAKLLWETSTRFTSSSKSLPNVVFGASNSYSIALPVTFSFNVPLLVLANTMFMS